MDSLPRLVAFVVVVSFFVLLISRSHSAQREEQRRQPDALRRDIDELNLRLGFIAQDVEELMQRDHIERWEYDELLERVRQLELRVGS